MSEFVSEAFDTCNIDLNDLREEMRLILDNNEKVEGEFKNESDKKVIGDWLHLVALFYFIIIFIIIFWDFHLYCVSGDTSEWQKDFEELFQEDS